MDERAARLRRMYASDPTADGEFVTGVLSTGIYCLPSCRGRKPRADNVRFFATPDEARAAGLRACLRCRPDDFWAGRRPERERLERLVERLRADPGAFASVGALAAAGGVGATKLHASCREHFHATPAELLVAARCDHARGLLAAGAPLADAAFAAGFESLSTFHERFRRATGLTPAAYRDLGRSRGTAGSAAASFVLRLPRGYLADATLRAWGRDPGSLGERTDGRHIARALRTPEGDGALLHVELGGGVARCRLESDRPLSPLAVRAAHAAVARMLGLPGDPAAFERRAARDPAGAALVAGRRGLRVPLTPDAFEALTWAVIGQQVNLGFAFTLRRRLLELSGGPAPAGFRTHPQPAAVAALDPADLVRAQYSRRKAEYLVDLAGAVASGALPLDRLAGAAAGRIEEALLAQRGVGPWTAHYVMLRGYGLGDCLPVGDAGLTLALQRFHRLPARPDAAATVALMAPWAPHRSLATFHLWASLQEPQPTPAPGAATEGALLAGPAGSATAARQGAPADSVS
jgi:AraC family transcriptional regulator of adaptative response / DNA-3-methyladenine glycosylase II